MEADKVISEAKQDSDGVPAAGLAGDAEAADYADGQAGDAADTAAQDATAAQARCLRRTCVINYQAARLPVSSQISA